MSIQELCEQIAINALNGGDLAGLVFRHDDSVGAVVTDMFSVKAAAPVPRLEGERGYRVNVAVEIRTATPTRNDAMHEAALARLVDASILSAAALAAGLTTGDDFTILDEEIGGDRSETKNLRKRTITVPMLVAINS